MKHTSIILHAFGLEENCVISTHRASMCSDLVNVQQKPLCMLACKITCFNLVAHIVELLLHNQHKLHSISFNFTFPIYFVLDNTIFFIPVPYIPVHALVSSFILVLYMHCG